MTLTAQQQCIFGAMCMDEQFRLQLFAAGTAPPAERRSRIGALIQGYAAGNAVQIDDSVTDNVMNIVRSESPCRQEAMKSFQDAKDAACPCWPC